jgi:hypothetical protein
VQLTYVASGYQFSAMRAAHPPDAIGERVDLRDDRKFEFLDIRSRAFHRLYKAGSGRDAVGRQRNSARRIHTPIVPSIQPASTFRPFTAMLSNHENSLQKP